MTRLVRDQGQALFGRKYQVTIAPDPSRPASLNYGNIVAGSAPLRITFDIKKDCKPTPNPGHIVIYNMNTANRALIEDGWAIQLQAGYADSAQTIWLGQVGKGIASKNPDLSTAEKAAEKKEGSDISYAIETAEGWGPSRLQTINKSYRRGVTLQQIFNDIATQMQQTSSNVGFPITLGALPTPFPAVVLKKKTVIHGACGECLSKILRPYGFEWFVHNNQLTVVAADDHTQDGIPYVSPQTGLIGIPSRGNEKSVTFTCLLNPQLAPGRLVRLDARDPSFQGYFKVRSCQFKGDTHGDEWSSQVECVPYNNPSLPITTAPIGA